MDLYAEHILEHFRSPRRKSLLPHPTVEREEVNASCGDTLTLQLSFKKDTVSSVGWDGTGCAVSQAGMSMLAETLTGKTLAELETMQPKDMRIILGVPISARRLKCALLPLLALRNALRQQKKEPPLTWAEIVEEDEERETVELIRESRKGKGKHSVPFETWAKNR
ncbi:MAG: iron-sulfur cluster assembly scaffold protein [Candidatus Peregrinibacteria bacterium]